MRPYLKYSAGAHVLLAVLGWQVLNWRGAKPANTVYSIDFVGGPASVITSAGPSGGAKVPARVQPPSSARPAPQQEFDEFGRRRGKNKRARISLPRPSLLGGWKAPKEQPAEEPQTAAPAEKPSGQAVGAQGTGGEGMPGAEASADMPNFPYPWYISRVRQMLWQQWQSRMPRGGGECVVVFSLLPNGGVVDVRTESSSGDSAFDLAALAAVQDAAPYPPLPQGFTEPFLKVHVTLRSQ